ncbi:MAG: LysR substrate-binding domain-containing protein [Alphaproteobacteria bacterium]|nr:LysR substrate-binding domain-containing protein [Alphaproteobacteria bacterium]
MNAHLDFSHLVAFEEAAGTGSFTRAAQSLGISQPALSHRIRLLEERVGRKLFLRQHKGVVLTPDGEVLFDAVTASLDRIRRVVDRFRQEDAHQRIRISLDFAFGSMWLMPRLTVNDLLPESIDLQINSAQLSPERHLRDGDVAFVLAWPDDMPDHAIRLFPEAVTPVCSPRFLAAHEGAGRAESLVDLPLIHNEGPTPDAWSSWRDWFADRGVDWTPSGTQSAFSTYQLVLQAAMAGRGVALGWRGLVDDYLATGQLVTPIPSYARSGRYYFGVLCLEDPSPEARRFLETVASLASRRAG